MKTVQRILIADDNPTNRDILRTRLTANGYAVVTADDGEQALAAVVEQPPDLILLDLMMPKVDGFEVCRRLKTDSGLPYIPIIVITARSDTRDVVAALEAGADEYLTKPVDQTALVARVKSMLRIKQLHETVQQQAAALADWNRALEDRVLRQVAEIERLGRLRRFLSPQVAEAVASGGEESLRAQRREVAVVFCDMRGSTAFSENTEPEEALAVFAAYHRALGEIVSEHSGTIEHRAGDGMMVIFNAPLLCPEPATRAVRMALAMRAQFEELAQRWRRRGHDLGFGVGISLGYATVGLIGGGDRYDYTANGGAVVLAARLCAEAAAGQIVVSQRVVGAIECGLEAESLGELTLKGFHRPVHAYNVLSMRIHIAD